MLKIERFPMDRIYVPAKRARTLDAGKVEAIAESILQDGERFVLVEGLHRLEALKALGETTVDGYLVQARRH
jgi:sulfiredoxin